MGILREYREGDRDRAESYLSQDPHLNIYLLSRLDLPEDGRGYVYETEDEIEGFAWFGIGLNLVIAGESMEFLWELAGLAADAERSWVMVVGLRGATGQFIDIYRRQATRKPRLDRPQDFYVQTRETLPEQRDAWLRLASEGDLHDLSVASARMSAEDFEIDPLRIDREAVRRRMVRKIHAGRAFIRRERGRLAFKTDLAVRHPAGGQVEGVYTAEDFRGRGIATSCLSELGHRLLEEYPFLSLHVATKNFAAIRAYEKAGYRKMGELRLAIFPQVL